MRLALLSGLLALSSCCVSAGCPDSVRWMLGTPLENGTYVITACVDDDCDEATFTIEGDSSSAPGSPRIAALSNQIAFRPDRTDGIRARLNITRDGALVLSDLRSLTWMNVTVPNACAPTCVSATIALE